jgi:hypothetical protein
MSSDNIAATALGERFNNAGVSIGNNKYDKGGTKAQKQSKVCMGSKGAECFFRIIV